MDLSFWSHHESTWNSKSPDAVASYYADDGEMSSLAAIRGLDARADCDDVFESPLDFRQGT